MLIADEREILIEAQDQLIELLVQEDEASRAEDWGRVHMLKTEIADATARRDEIRYSIPSASSSDATMPASMFHSLESTPDENGQRPCSRYPPSTLRARPAGNTKDDAISASGSCFHTASCAAESNIASIQ